MKGMVWKENLLLHQFLNLLSNLYDYVMRLYLIYLLLNICTCQTSLDPTETSIYLPDKKLIQKLEKNDFLSPEHILLEQKASAYLYQNSFSINVLYYAF